MPSTRALVTGASAGLGIEYARLFAADGHHLVLTARRQERLVELAAELASAHGVDVEVIPADLTDPEAPRRIVRQLEEQDIAVSHLVNNAGLGSNGRFWELDAERELAMIQVNVTALVHLTRLLLPGMVERGFGRILDVASTAGFQPGPGMATYYATKAFVLSFSEAIAHELRGTGVTVTCHCPGATATEFADLAGNADSKLFAASVASAAEVARHGYQAMQRGTTVSVHGALNWLGTQSLRLGPRAVVRGVAGWINSKA